MYTCPGCLNFFQPISCIAPRAILPLVLIHGIVPVSMKETRMTSSCINTWKHTVSLTQNEDIRTRCTPRGMHCRYGSWIRVIVKTHTIYKTRTIVFIFGTACQIYCYGRYCVRRSVSPQVPENPSGPLVDNFIVLPCFAFGVACVKLLPGVDRWNSLDDPSVIGPCHCEVWGWPRH